MPSSSFTFFDSFSEKLAKGVHDLHSDTLAIYFTNVSPDVSNDHVKADLLEINNGGGYIAGGYDTQNSVSRTGNDTFVIGIDVTVTATGNVDTFQHVILFNFSNGTNDLIGYWSYPSPVSMVNTDTFKTDFGTEMFKIQI